MIKASGERLWAFGGTLIGQESWEHRTVEKHKCESPEFCLLIPVFVCSGQGP